MSDYALIQISTNTYMKRAVFASPPVQPHPSKDRKWLPLITIDPVFDPDTQVREGPITTVTATEVTLEWTVRAKNAGETDADKGRLFDAIEKVLLEIAFAHENRLRALEGQPARTKAQFKTYAKGLL